MNRRLPLLLAGGLLLGGCAQTTNLEPAPSARQVAGVEDAAAARQSGVNMLVQAGIWPGGPGVAEEVTPLRVKIENDSAQPLRINYKEFTLVGPDGKVYRALPPFRIDGEVATSPTGGPIAAPAFGYGGFAVARPYGPIYPGIGISPSPFLVDPFYYDRYYGYWRQTELPTQEMLSLAIPEGVLQPGGEVSGYLYFEKVPEEERLRLKYRANLVNAESGVNFARVTIPFIANPQA